MMRALSAIFLATLLLWVAPAEAQSIVRELDYSAIRRGARIASSCYENNVGNMQEKSDCVARALWGSADNPNLHVGVTYSVWLIEATAQDRIATTLIATTPETKELNRVLKMVVDSSYAMMLSAERRVQVGIKDLCKITQTNCAEAIRLSRQHQKEAIDNIGKK